MVFFIYLISLILDIRPPARRGCAPPTASASPRPALCAGGDNGHHAHAGPVCPPSVVDIVPIHGWDASEITIATVAVDLDSNPPLGALFTIVLFPSQVQLEARSTSLVETFSSRAERRGLPRFPPSSCRARARISTYVT